MIEGSELCELSEIGEISIERDDCGLILLSLLTSLILLPNAYAQAQNSQRHCVSILAHEEKKGPPPESRTGSL
jgi:hypothetical protein